MSSKIFFEDHIYLGNSITDHWSILDQYTDQYNKKDGSSQLEQELNSQTPVNIQNHTFLQIIHPRRV